MKGSITSAQGFDISGDERKLKASFVDLKPDSNISWGPWTDDGWMAGKYGDVCFDLSKQPDGEVGICIGCVNGPHHGTIYFYGDSTNEETAKRICEEWLHDIPS